MAVQTRSEEATAISNAQLLALYRQMVQIRKTEEQLVRAHQAGLIPGACHTYVGEEAIAAGVCAHLRPDDTVLSTHRGHGHALAKGVTPTALIAELLGRATGCSHGRGGSMHLFSPDVGMLGTSGIVGPSMLMATGAAYTYKLQRSDRVSVAFFGDGGTNNGAFHEGLNLAAIWDLPVLFVCENNQYAQYQSVTQDMAIANVADRAAAYGIPGVIVDGSDVLAVHCAVVEAVKRARDGDGPSLIEAKTYRFEGHFLGDPEPYRTKEEVAQARASRDPLIRFGAVLQQLGVAGAESLQRLDARVKDEVERAVTFGEASPEPGEELLLTDIYTGADAAGREI